MPFATDVERRALPNGLTLLVQRDTSAPVVAVVTYVRAGYFDEPDAWVGIAHVLEHMYFKGTARRGPGDIARETQQVGGYINAGTIYDKTVYYTVLPSADGGLEKALDVQADALMHAALDQDELRRELEVIIQEARRKRDTPSAVITETLYEQLFRVHRMRRWRIGTERGLRQLTAADVRAYYETRYTPDRVVVALVGALDVAHAAAIAEETLAGWSRPSATVEGSPPEPSGTEASGRVLRGDVERPLASVGWRTVPTLHPDAAALDVAATILGAGRGSSLYRTLRIPGIAASAYASHYTPTEVGVFELGLEADAVHIDEAVERSWGLAAQLATAQPVQPELERARALLATSWARRNESMEGRAAALCEGEALGDYHLVDDMLQWLLGVSADDVQRVAREYLEPSAASVALYLGEDGETRFENAWPPRTAGVQVLPPIAVHEAGLPRAVRRAAERNRLTGGITHWVLPGIDILARPKRGSGVVTLQFQFPWVPSCEDADSAGISSLLARTALRGAGGLQAEALAQAAELLGGTITPSVGSETMGWRTSVRPEGMERAARLLAMLAREPHLQLDDVTRERVLQASDARRARDDMFRYPAQQVLAQAFPDHAYGLPRLGEPERVLGYGVDMLQAWSGRLLNTRPVLIAVGDFVPDDVPRLLEPLAQWEALTTPPSSALPAPSWAARRSSEPRDKEQSAIAIAFAAPPFASRERYPLRVVAALLSGLAGRLFDALRERRSLAYTVTAIPWLARQAGAMLCYIATSPDRETEAREGMLAELRRLVTEPPTTAELDRARSYAAGSVEIRQQSGGALAGEILEAWVHGTVDDLDAVPERLRQVSHEDVVTVAESVFLTDEWAEYVVRGTGGSS
jgi:zinc protease